MKSALKNLASGTTLAVLASAWIPNAHADDFSDRFDVRGFGYQDYVQTSDNTYLGADHRGTWDNNFLGVVMAATVNDRSKLWAQLETSSTEPTRFTWFFVDYQISENLRAHIGRVKFPLGLYNETIDAKFLQVTQLEPALYQTAADFVHDAYNGAGLDYEHDVGGGHLLWQVYGGNVYDLDPPEDSRDRRAFGGRVSYRTAIPGLRIEVSGYRTVVEALADKSLSNEDRIIGSVDYVNDRLDLKAEYAVHSFFGVDSNSYYVQARYSLNDRWAPYARYEDTVLDKDQKNDPSFYQKTIVAGLQYTITDNLSLRIENHFNHGYGLPVASEEVPAGEGTKNWNLTIVGVNFSF